MFSVSVNSYLFEVIADGSIVPVGHNEKQRFGDITIDRSTDSVYRNVPNRYFDITWQYVGRLSDMANF